jgi:OmcA/MtrC family decaheme c-type cytochrome
MGRWRRGFVLVMAVGAVALSGSRNAPIVVGMRPSEGAYPLSSKEAYFTTEQLDYVRPGFHITVNSVTIPADLRPLVDLSFTDDLNQPLDRLGQVTPGALSVSQVLAYYDPATRNYVAYTTRVQTSAPPSTTPGVKATQSSADSGGTWTDLAVGHSTYKFKTALPAGYDQTKTTTVAIYATRDLITPGASTKNYYANVEYDFRPDGQTITDKWDILSNAACNTCHNPLSAHGGSRQDVKLCVTCHNPQTVAGTPNVDPDTGNTIDFKVMIHKIHMGGDLPSVKAGGEYHIIGFNQSDNIYGGDPLKQVPDVVLPQDIRNCATCHRSDLGNTNSATWYTFPSSSACGSCHDNINFVTGENHVAGAQPDTACAHCHQPQGSAEWDTSILGAHTVPTKSAQLKGVNAKIVSVTNTAPGQKPTIVFNTTQNDGTAIPPSAFTTQNSDGTTSSGLNVVMSGPTTDYSIPPQIRERADGAAATGGNYTYTFMTPVPADATGTWGFSIEARIKVTLNPAPHDTTTATDAAFNPVYYAPVTDSVAVARREVVDIGKCNACHDKLAFHGSNRLNTQECVFCHNPNALDSSTPPESIDFKRMIHKIHRGTDLTQTYSISGDSFNGVRFPGDLRDCETCHISGTEEVSETPPAGLLPTITQTDYFSPQQHYSASCLACHDTQSAAAHAFSNTVTFPNGKPAEACATCHAPEDEFAVDKVHAR